MNHPQALAQQLAFYATPPHACAYLPERSATTLFADPYAPMDNGTYSALADMGFRRSGRYVYRPRCADCQACIPVRIPAAELRVDRSQRRAWECNRDLVVDVRAPDFSEEHFALYRRYIEARHPGGGMETDDPEQYRQFLTSSWADTRFVEFRQGERLLSVAVVDCLATGLSAVYTFFEPDEPRRSLGVLAVLWQAAEARRLGLPWVYLGYLIRESPKMAYKIRYQPLEGFVDGRWQRLA